MIYLYRAILSYYTRQHFLPEFVLIFVCLRYNLGTLTSNKSNIYKIFMKINIIYYKPAVYLARGGVQSSSTIVITATQMCFAASAPQLVITVKFCFLRI